MPVKLRGDNQGKKCKCKYPQCFLRFLRLTDAYKKISATQNVRGVFACGRFIFIFLVVIQHTKFFSDEACSLAYILRVLTNYTMKILG